MSTGCCQGTDTCEAAPGRSTDMPQMLLSLTNLRSNFVLKHIYEVIVIINGKKDIMKGVYKGGPLGVLSHKVKFQQDVKI